MGLLSRPSPLTGEMLRVGFHGLMAAVLESGRVLLVLSAALLTEAEVTVEYCLRELLFSYVMMKRFILMQVSLS